MNPVKSYLRKYWSFLVFFGVLMGVAFLYFRTRPFDFFLWELWLQVAIGFVIGIIIAFLITLIYHALVPGTFKKVLLFYLLIITLIPALYAGSYASFTIAIIVQILFLIAAAISLVGVIIRHRKNPFALAFHIVGLFAWFVFLALYYVNLRSSYSPC